ncbi:perforin-like protein 4, putative [Plasmodium ovale]|uniref:Perforin-like protein 4, putative n=2 Tax=Plasmodium ovale TaxID=36330 RepID=A0A1D3KY03_PLAOA|nr:perforin-like protein 4, putative [Plasmodium ovale]
MIDKILCKMNNLISKSSKIGVCLFIGYAILSSVVRGDTQNEGDSSMPELFSKYIGRGYDILFGYPLPNNELVEDPGFKEVIFDTKSSINVVSEDVCQKGEYFNFIEDINDVMNLAMDNINVDDLNLDIKPFSASMPYRSYFTDLEIKKKKYIVALNTCLHRYAVHNLRDSTKYINKDFLLDSEKLPIFPDKINQENKCSNVTYLSDTTNEHCIKTLKPWIEFFQKYGTHVVLSAHFGGKSINTLEVTLQKLEEVKIYNYKYPIRNIPYLNVFKAPSLLRDVFNSNKRVNSNKVRILTGGTNGEDDLNVGNREDEGPAQVRSREDDITKNNFTLDVKGGSEMDEKWNELTYEIWKNSIYSNMLPIYLNLISLSSFMRIEKKESYNKALLYYNNIFGMDRENYYFSQDITNVLSDGRQITGSGKGSLILSCPVGYIKSTGLILIFDKSERVKGSKDSAPRVKIHPCYSKGEYDVSCSYISKRSDLTTFGWLYCVKYNFIKFETVYKTSDNMSKEETLEIKCPEGNILSFGFKMKLDQKHNFDKIQVKPCVVGDDKCMVSKMKQNSDYLLWGFCVPLSFRSTSSLQLTYIYENDVTTDVRGECSDVYRNKYDNIFLGFSFSFDNKLETVKISPCEQKTKFCLSKASDQSKSGRYVGMFLLCRYDGGAVRKFAHH